MSDTPAAKTIKSATAKAFEAPFEAFSFAVPSSADVPAAFREFADKALTGSKEAYDKMKSAAEDATEALEDSFETARVGMLELGNKSIDAAKSNADATFAFAKEFMTVKTFAEAIALQSSFARQQMEAFTAQAKDFQASSQKFITEASRPVKASVEKAMKSAKLN